MKEVTVQFVSGRKIIAKNIIDYVESEKFDVIITDEEEHITLFKNQIEYMIVRDLEESLNPGIFASADTGIMDKV